MNSYMNILSNIIAQYMTGYITEDEFRDAWVDFGVSIIHNISPSAIAQGRREKVLVPIKKVWGVDIKKIMEK